MLSSACQTAVDTLQLPRRYLQGDLDLDYSFEQYVVKAREASLYF